MTDQLERTGFYRQPLTDEIQPLISDVAMVHLLRGSLDNPSKLGYHALRVRDPELMPRNLEPEQMGVISWQISEVVRNGQSKHLPDSPEAGRKARARIGQVMGWLGELAAHDKDLVTASSALNELRAHASFSNWRRARRLKQVIETVSRLEYELPTRQLDDQPRQFEV